MLKKAWEESRNVIIVLLIIGYIIVMALCIKISVEAGDLEAKVESLLLQDEEMK